MSANEEVDPLRDYSRRLAGNPLAFASRCIEGIDHRPGEQLRRKEPYAMQISDELRERLARDPHRPRFHFLPPAHWMNDPNGLIYWNGEYHLFYQHNPNGAFWGTMHWGHAVSRDLIHWTHLPIALAPTPGGADWDGCFSGCAVENDGVPTLVYTGVTPEVQCLATSPDGLRTWQKHPANPVIAAPPEGLEVTGFRDPWVWRQDNEWQMLLGSGIKDVGGAVLRYTSPDLVHWEYRGPICVGDAAKTGTVWECPNFFPLGDRHVLIVSPIPLRKSIYFVGTYADGQFTPETDGVLDDGGHFYAPQTFLDAEGNRMMFGWLWEGRSDAAQRAAGWAGVQSLPRVLSLGEDGRLRMEPARAVQTLRGEHRRFENLDVSPSGSPLLLDTRGDALEINATFAPGDATEVGLAVRRSPDGEEETRIVCDRRAGRLSIDRSRSSLDAETTHDAHGGAFPLAPGEAVTLQVLLDRSVVEVYANGRACVTSRVYPSRSDSLGVSLFASGGSVRVTRLDVWQMADADPVT
jgi:beta-fructofuranosidase